MQKENGGPLLKKKNALVVSRWQQQSLKPTTVVWDEDGPAPYIALLTSAVKQLCPREPSTVTLIHEGGKLLLLHLWSWASSWDGGEGWVAIHMEHIP